MEAHASRGRRTLEEIRQKRAAERMQHALPIAASHVDSHGCYTYMLRSTPHLITIRCGNQRAGAELLARVQELENGNTELIDEKGVEKDALVNRLNDLERNVVPSLQKNLNDISLEKDAAVVAKEDALAQLRSMKKRLKEAEEEQYKAEEDSASLRAQLNTLQQQVMGHSYSGYTMGISTEESVAMEKEIQDLQAQLKQESLLRQQEQQKLAEESQLRQQEQEKLAKEQIHIASLEAEKQQLEDQITMLTKKATGMEDTYTYANLSFIMSGKTTVHASKHQDREKLENQLHDMALMIERLEGSRQKLLMEIDSQSSEIEKLFEENSALSTSYQEAIAITVQWENQVKFQVRDCLKQNEELRSHLEKLRLEQASLLEVSNITTKSDGQIENSISNLPEMVTENISLKGQLIKEQSRSESLLAEIMKLSAELRKAVQAQNNLVRLYRPVLRDIESNLMKMKQETYATIQ
ncbi:myosin heavy chain-related [Zea mays]|uniref:Myosin heavy chain-related n=1 Tax=Zea mays TaxID=4577 RepID=A0A1D6PDV2_MAIZE|nr:myosin heavy chain-related [Zea mays]